MDASVETYVKTGQQRTSMAVWNAQQSLRNSLEPQYTAFIQQVAHQPGGVRLLVQMRQHVLEIIRSETSATTDEFTALRSVDAELKRHLQSWFGVGFLQLHRFDWTSSVHVLEKIIDGEAVHTIRSWDELKQRVGPQRRCYGFMHPSMPDEPLVFIQVALTDKIPGDIHSILSDKDLQHEHESKSKCAIFYSISATQKGLAGIDLGNLLIKRVVNELRRDFPNITQFCTLSPMPGFASWLMGNLNAKKSDLLTTEESKLVSSLRFESGDVFETLKGLLSAKESHENPALKPIMLRLGYQYILGERKRKQALDPVANFHIRNGASLYRINYAADLSSMGRKQSFGLMANYMYELERIEDRHVAYVMNGEIETSGSESKEWARKISAKL